MHGNFSINERITWNNDAEIIWKPVIAETVTAMELVLFYAI